MSNDYAPMSRQDYAIAEQQNQERDGDRERQYRRDEDNYEDTQSEPIVQKMMGDDYSKYFNDEGEDVRDLAARAEAMREDKELNDFLIAQYEAEQERNIDHARDNNP